ncbi:MAG TPA: hypothetical protein PLZ45_03400 [Ferruginibacter sp.]|nr:hypothetical protein [Ferruginibacter sp.]
MFIHKRKITALGFLLLVLMPLFFSAGIMLKQKVMQLHRRARFEKESLEIIVLPAEKIHWIKRGKELIVDGKLFDVKSFSTQNGTTSFTGFFDGEEDELVDRLGDATEQKKEAGNPVSQLSIKFLFSPVYSEPLAVSFLNPWHTVTTGYHFYTEITSAGVRPLDIPPPRC